MKYRGKVKNGVILLDGDKALRDGTVVDVEPILDARCSLAPGSIDAVLQHAGIWATTADEVDRMMNVLHTMKRQELALQQNNSENDVL